MAKNDWLVKRVFRKIFWPVFWIIFLIITVITSKVVYDMVIGSQYLRQAEETSWQIGENELDAYGQDRLLDNVALPEHCTDQIYNNGEQGIDCGWSCQNKCRFIDKCGRIGRDEIWEGNVYVSCYVEVPEGIQLRIQPGSIVKFKHDRDYQTFDRAGLHSNGGQIVAQGTPEQRIWFTSAAQDPINGDWWGVSVENTHNSIFDYVIVEFSEMGIEQLDSSLQISNSIIRWVNAEGLYAERSRPFINNNLLYANGYHEIALEQFNEAQISNNIFRNGHYAIHHEKTSAVIENNYFQDYENEVISAGMESRVRIRNNTFINVGSEPFNIYDGSVADIAGNIFDNSQIPARDDPANFKLDYIPGEVNDLYPYVYADEDATRRTVKKIGKDLYFGWALEYANDHLWRFSLGEGKIGKSLDLIKIDPETGKYELFGNNNIMNPRGLTFDGNYFWVNDFSLLKLFKFKVEDGVIEIIDSFDIPEKEKGGTMGLTSDDDFLYLRSRNGEKMYRLDKNGNVVDEIEFEFGGIGQDLVWTGEYFWTTGGCQKGLCKWTKDGRLAGEIYNVAKDPWAIAFDGEYLWTIQRTSELWNDNKIYKIEIKDDRLEWRKS